MVRKYREGTHLQRPRFSPCPKGQNNVRIGTPILILCSLIAIILSGCAGTGGDAGEMSGHLLATGSTALQPLVTVAAKMYEQQHPNVHIVVKGGGSLQGLNDVTTNKADIGDSDLYADPGTYPDPNLTDHIVCVIPFAMITNIDVNLPSLSHNDIIRIFSTGDVHNWNELGGPNLPIVPVARTKTSGTRDTFRKYVLEGRDESDKLPRIDKSTDVRDTVAKTPGAISYLALSVLNPSVHTLAIDGEKPTTNNIISGHYTFWAYEHMYTLGDNNALATNFLNFLLTADVQTKAEQSGYIPISSMNVQISSGIIKGQRDLADSAAIAKGIVDGRTTTTQAE